MLKIPVVKGNLNKALKIFKKKFKKTGVLKELRDRQQFTKKSLKRKLIKNKAIHQQKHLRNKENE
jgi:small subunit ribosomal protein S21